MGALRRHGRHDSGDDDGVRRLLTRAVPLAVIAAVAFGAGIVIAAGPGRAERQPRDELRHRVGARRLRQHVLAARPDLAPADVGDAVRRGVPDRREDRDARVGHRLTRRKPRRRRDPGADVVADAAVRHAARDARRAARRQRLGGDGPLLADRCCFPGCVAAISWRARTSLPPRATLLAERRHAAGAGTRPDLADSGRRLADRRHARADPRRPRPPIRGGGLPGRTPRSGSTGSSASSRRSWRARRAARCSRASGCSRESTPMPGHTVTTTINPAIEQAAINAMGGSFAGIAAMDPRTGGAARRWPASRSRPSSRPARR